MKRAIVRFAMLVMRPLMAMYEERAQHEIDVLALAGGQMPRSHGVRIRAIGEAKATERARGRGDLGRLEHLRGL